MAIPKRPSPLVFAAALAATVLCITPTDAFVVVPRSAHRLDQPSLVGGTLSSLLLHNNNERSVTGSPCVASSTSLFMAPKKRRRKRKDGAAASPSSPAEVEAAEEAEVFMGDDALGGDLPGFDLGEDEQVEEFKSADSSSSSSSATATTAAAASLDAGLDASVVSGGTDAPSVDMSDPKVLEAMKGRSGRMAGGLTDVDDLLASRNRELEKAFTFDDSEVKEDLPTLGDLKGGRKSSSRSSSTDTGGSFVVEQKVGTKRARAEARRLAAIEAEKAAEEEKSFLEKVPQFLNEKGEVSPIKILEAGTWGGIAILVLWEVYINSPLFERTAPMAPVVFELLY